MHRPEETVATDHAEMMRVPAVRFERLLPGPMERIWEFLSDTGRLPAWYGDGVIEPRLGGSVMLMAGHVRGVIARWQPPRRLTYSWNVFADGEDKSSYPESYLALELEPRGGDVLLTLTHLPVLERFEKRNAMGWHSYLDMLEAAVRGARPEPREVHMKRNAARYGVDLVTLAM